MADLETEVARLREGGLRFRNDVVDSRRRRRYRTTAHGLAVLAECRAALGELAAEVLSSDQP